MRVCFCTHRLPYPPVSGGRTETYRLIEGLARHGYTLDVVTYCDDETLAAEMAEETGAALYPVPGVPDRTPRNLIRNVFSGDPLPVMKAKTDRYLRTVRDRTREADVLHLHALQTSYLARSIESSIPIVLRFNNVKHQIYRQYAKYTDNPAKAAYAYLQYLKTKRYETSITEAGDLSLMITPQDRALLWEYGAGGNIEVLPAGVDPDRFTPSGRPDEDGVVTFFGSMDYHPNEEGALWFSDEVFPRLQRRVPRCTFEIVGKGPSDRVRRLGDRDGITVTGFVDDIREYIGRASVIVLPIRVGTGIRMKALHAMAMGKAIVTTPIGVQGINVEDGRHAAIAETPAEFAEAVTTLLDRPEVRDQLGRNARALVTVDHDWDTIVPQLGSYYSDVVAGLSEGHPP